MLAPGGGRRTRRPGARRPNGRVAVAIAPVYTTAMRLRIVALGLVVAIAGCGDRNEEIEQDIRDACNSLVVGQSTLRDGAVALGRDNGNPVFISCESNLLPLAGQTCSGAGPICQFRWQFLTNDCGPGGCTLVCDVRTESQSGGGPPTTLDAVICARRVLDEQPFVLP